MSIPLWMLEEREEFLALEKQRTDRELEEAQWRLAEAAPDLLAALEALVAFEKEDSDAYDEVPDEWLLKQERLVDRAEAAIKKARGEE